jgi:hypothetical protein
MAKEMSAAEIRRFRDAEEEAWQSLCRQIEAAQSIPQARAIPLKGPVRGAPGRRWFSNLAIFAAHFKPPGGASRHELRMYARLIERVGRETFPPGTADNILSELRKAIDAAIFEEPLFKSLDESGRMA